MASASQVRKLYFALQLKLEEIEKLLPTYKITLVARHPSKDNADVIMSMDNLDLVQAAIERLKSREPVVKSDIQ